VKKTVLVLVATLALILPSDPAFSLNHLSDMDLEEIECQSGITISHSLAVDLSIDQFGISDTKNGNWLELSNLTRTSTSSGFTDIDCFTVSDPASPIDGQTYVAWQMYDREQTNLTTVGDISLAGQSIGSLTIENVQTPNSYLYLGSHMDGTVGIDYERGLQLTVDDFSYSAGGNELSLSGIHLYGDIDDGDGDGLVLDPTTDPSLWTFDGYFTVGDIYSGTPATFDVATDSDTSTTFMALNTPMSGDIWIESIRLGTTDFGTAIIDGLDVDHCYVTIAGGEDFSSFSVEETDEYAAVQLGIQVSTYATIDQLMMGYWDNGTGAGWDQNWTGVSLGTATEDLVLNDFFIQVNYDDVNSPGRQVESVQIGFKDVTGQMTADTFASLSQGQYNFTDNTWTEISSRLGIPDSGFQFNGDTLAINVLLDEPAGHGGIYFDFGNATPIP